MSASITTRTTKSGRRFVVRYRLGGRSYPVEHGGSFPTMKEARARRDLVAGEIAAGRNPREVLAAMKDRPQVRTFAQWAKAYRESRVDLSEETLKNLDSHVLTMKPVFGDRDPATLTAADVQTWIATSRLAPSTLRRYLVSLRAILDHAGVDPNPARSNSVRLPRQEQAIVEPPSAVDVAAIIVNAPARWRLALTTLAETGMRVGELHELEWRDVDEANSRFRIRAGKTRAARRWVAVPADLMEEVSRSAPPDDRSAERRVFPGATPAAVNSVIGRACKAAKIAHWSPHDLRHRYASVQVANGVPVTTLAAQLGHSRKSVTLDVYSHVLLND